MTDRALLVRAAAARQLLAADPGLDRLELLSYVVWPTAALATVPPQRLPVTNLEAARMTELASQGLSHYAIAEQVGRPRTTVSMILRRAA